MPYTYVHGKQALPMPAVDVKKVGSQTIYTLKFPYKSTFNHGDALLHFCDEMKRLGVNSWEPSQIKTLRHNLKAYGLKYVG
jgi:hypothetical protein